MMSEAPTKEAQERAAEVLRLLYDHSAAAMFGISFDSFSLLLLKAEAPRPKGGDDARNWYESLPIDDLVLAHACAAGNNAAWEHFVAQYRSMLQSAAMAFCRNELSAHEVVALLFGDLFGTSIDAGGTRRSKLEGYTGRGTLASWLRATLAQACIDQHRLSRRFISLNEALPALGQMLSGPEIASGSDARLDAAIEQAIRMLTPECRFLLKAYYFDRMNLIQIGALLGVHESTISRRLRSVARGLRHSVLQELVKGGMSLSAARQTLKSDVRYISADVEGSLIKAL